MRAAAFGMVLVLVGCAGGGGNETTGAAPSTTTAGAGSTIASSTLPVTTSDSGGGRTPVPTTLAPRLADAAIDLSLIPEATAGYDFQPSTINGVSYVNALRISSNRTPAKVEINAGRSRKRLLGSLGIPDDQESDSVHQVEISLDNSPPIFSTPLNFGETKQIDLDVTNALRVRITVSSKTGNYGRVAIGNPRFA